GRADHRLPGRDAVDHDVGEGAERQPEEAAEQRDRGDHARQAVRASACAASPGRAVSRAPWPARAVRSRLAVSSAARAASPPLLPSLPPARSCACSHVSVVSPPNATGLPTSNATRPTAAASPATYSKW